MLCDMENSSVVFPCILHATTRYEWSDEIYNDDHYL